MQGNICNAYKLPASLSVGGAEYKIRTDFDVILDIFEAVNDPDLLDEARGAIILISIYPDWKTIPPEHQEEALKKAYEFIDCGQKDDGKIHPQLVDWEQDAGIIVPAINSVAHTDIRLIEHLHWWTFFGWFMEIRESLFSEVIHIRQKKAKRKKLEKWEQEFYRENKALIDLKPRESEETKKEKDSLLKWL